MDRIRWPAEWEPQKTVWLAMPHDEDEWGQYFEPARRTVQAMADLVCVGQEVNLLVPSDAAGDLKAHQRRDIARYGDIWLRDTGPIFVQRNGEITAATFAFNGWGEKYNFPHDREVAETIAALAQVETQRFALCLEGGAIDGNGQGTIVSTRQCLLNANRNPTLGEAQVQAILQRALGCETIIWLNEGLQGDHTDGHVDNLARFVSPTTVVCTMGASSDPNAAVFQEIYKTLQGARTAQGEELTLVTLPSPGAIFGPSGLLATSYCNFLITNDCVLVPTFEKNTDREAMDILCEMFPTRTVHGIEAFALATGGGTVHCISQQQPIGALCQPQ